MLQQQVPHVQNGTTCGFATTTNNECNVRGDFLGGKHVAIDNGFAQFRNDVGCNFVAFIVEQEVWLQTAFFHNALNKIFEVLARHETFLLVVAATNAAHHVLVPVVELVASFVGKAKHLTHHANGELIRKCLTQLHGVLACCRVVFGHARCRVKPFINHLIGKFANGTNALGECSTY